MKHFLTFFLVGMIGLLSVNMSYSQAVNDRAVVPVSVTLNSILRLNIESGGNVEFNFNTLEQYQNGINGLGSDDQYSTQISVASSVNWELDFGAEDGSLISTDDTSSTGGSMALDYILYQVTLTGSGDPGNYFIYSSTGESGPQALHQFGSGAPIIQNDGTNAGDVNKNAFRIDWACGVPTSVEGNSAGNLMGSALTGGRYSTNVFFVLQPE